MSRDKWSWREAHRFGSARFAGAEDLGRAGMLTPSPTALLHGFMGKQSIYYDGDGGLVLIAGPRSGKLRDVLAYNICSGNAAAENMLILDMKVELAPISQDQTPDGKHCRFWDPLGLGGMSQDRVNPTGHLTWSSPSLFSDMKVFTEGLVPLTNAENSYFTQNGRRYLEAIGLGLTKRNGVLTLPDLYRAVTAIPGGGAEWMDVAYEMYASGIDLCVGVEAEIDAGRKDSSGGFRGILGEVQAAVSCLSDPVLRASVSPPFDFSLDDLCRDEPPLHVYLMCPPELIQAWAPVIKAIFSGAMVLKARKPRARRQTWLLDECAQLKGFDLVAKMFSYGAGIGIRPWAIFQEVTQMDALGPGARREIMGGASVRAFFGTRDYESAKLVSEMIGGETLAWRDVVQRGKAQLSAHELLKQVLAGETFPFQAAPRLRGHLDAARHFQVQRRALVTPDEVMTLPGDRQLIFADGLPGPVYAERRPYWTQRFMAGRYHPNPYHPPHDRVRVETRWGPRWRPVIVEPVPEAFADYPQYRGGAWSRIGE